MVSASACFAQRVTAGQRLWTVERELQQAQATDTDTAAARCRWCGISYSRGYKAHRSNTALSLLPTANEVYGST